MPELYGERRGPQRAVAVVFRMTEADRENLKQTAAEREMSVQQLLEERVLGRAKPLGRPGPTRRQAQAEELISREELRPTG